MITRRQTLAVMGALALGATSASAAMSEKDKKARDVSGSRREPLRIPGLGERIRTRMRAMERAAFYAAWQEKKLRSLFLTAAGNSGNAATRIEGPAHRRSHDQCNADVDLALLRGDETQEPIHRQVQVSRNRHRCDPRPRLLTPPLSPSLSSIGRGGSNKKKLRGVSGS